LNILYTLLGFSIESTFTSMLSITERRYGDNLSNWRIAWWTVFFVLYFPFF